MSPAGCRIDRSKLATQHPSFRTSMKPPCGVRQKDDSGLHSFSQMNTTLMQAKTAKAETQPGGALCVSCCADLRKSCSVCIRQHRLPRLSPCADERLSTESPEKQRLVESWQLPSPWCNFQWQPRQLYCPIFKRLKLKSYSFFFFFSFSSFKSVSRGKQAKLSGGDLPPFKLPALNLPQSRRGSGSI